MKKTNKPLSPFEQWMVQQQLGYVAANGLETVIKGLRANGYDRVADAVKQKWSNANPSPSPGLNKELRKMKTAYFNRFTIDMPDEAVPDCSHQGACDDDVAYWSQRIRMPAEATPDAIRAELKEYGAWDAEELADDAQNLNRIIWIAAGNIKEDERYAEKYGKAD